MVEKQHKVFILHNIDHARNYGFGQEFSYQIVSLTVTKGREVTKQPTKASHCVDCHYFA